MKFEGNGMAGLKRKGFFRRRWWQILLLLVIGGIVYSQFSKSNQVSYEFVEIAKKDLVSAIEVTGKISRGAIIDLSFLVGGKISKINFDEGDVVKVGGVIAELKNNDQRFALDRTLASLNAAKANFDQRNAGATFEDVRISEAQVMEAEAAVRKARVLVENASNDLRLAEISNNAEIRKAELLLKDAEVKLENAKKNVMNTGSTVDQSIENAQRDLQAQLFSGIGTLQQSLSNAKLFVLNDGNSVFGSDYVLLDRIRVNSALNLYLSLKIRFDNLNRDITSKLVFTKDDVVSFAEQLIVLMSDAADLHKKIADLLVITQTTNVLTQEKLNGFRNSNLADLNSVNAGLGVLTNKLQTLKSAEVNSLSSLDNSDANLKSAEAFYEQQLQVLEQAKVRKEVDMAGKDAMYLSAKADLDMREAGLASARAALDFKKAKPRSVDLAFLQAQIALANIDVNSARENLEKTFLKAPKNGVLTMKLKEVGEDVVPSEKVFQMISDDKFKIEVDVAEVDVRKVKVGLNTEIKVDAFGRDRVFKGRVTKVAPTATLIQDVVFYKAEVTVDDVNEMELKPGMTADVDIILEKKVGVLSVNEKAVQTENDGRKYVRVLEGNEEKRIYVETGIVDRMGEVEISGEVKDGQKVIVRTLNGKR